MDQGGIDYFALAVLVLGLGLLGLAVFGLAGAWWFERILDWRLFRRWSPPHRLSRRDQTIESVFHAMLAISIVLLATGSGPGWFRISWQFLTALASLAYLRSVRVRRNRVGA